MNEMYALIILIATIIGAITGLGGGVIIKPLFDLLGYHDAQTIGVLSAFAVFTMSVISLFKQKSHVAKVKINIVVFISLGSFSGGIFGESIFGWIKLYFQNDAMLKLVQSSLLFSTLVLIVIYTIFKERIRTLKIDNFAIIFLTGLFLGTISVFLGIGGGPLNIVFLSLFFSFNMKDSVIYSITTVFFAQMSKLTQIYIINQFSIYDARLILWICVFAVLGGYIGTKINQKISSQKVERIYLYAMISLVLLTSINILKSIYTI